MNKYLIIAFLCSAVNAIDLRSHAKTQNIDQIAKDWMALLSTDGDMYITLDECFAFVAASLAQYPNVTPQQRKFEYD